MLVDVDPNRTERLGLGPFPLEAHGHPRHAYTCGRWLLEEFRTAVSTIDGC